MIQTDQNEELGRLNEVWVQLSQEDQTGVIQLMAKLVLKLVVGQSESGWQEVGDEQDSD
jgi:hypothetical protein